MKVVDLQGKRHSWNLANYVNNERANASSLHKTCRELLKELFPAEVILEEVGLPGTKMFVDFYIHAKRLAIEVNGSQHYEYNSFHFKDKHTFLKAQKRDKDKLAWLENNGIELIVLPYTENIDEFECMKKLKAFLESI